MKSEIKVYGNLEIAKLVFNKLMSNGAILDIIKAMPEQLDYANVTTEVIADAFLDYSKEFKVNVQWYRSRNPWSRALATTYTGNYRYVGINSRTGNRSLASLCGSVAHETGHCFEYYTRTRRTGYAFNHGSNSPVGKSRTFQYQLGRRVKAYVEANQDELLRSIGAL